MHVDPTHGTVGELMTRDPILVSLDTPLSEVAELLDRFGISGVPVVDWGGHLVGVVSQTDLLRARAAEDLWARWPGLAARHLMTRPALTASTETPIEEAVARMESNHVHRLVVVGDDGETPIGVISTTDLVRAMAGRVDR
jgi:CBS domain-containing protein